MRACIFSDVHANLPALERFVEHTRGTVDSFVCLGDVVNYGPWNDECLEIVCALPHVVLLEGNHERLFLGAEPIADEIELVQDFFAKSREYFSRPERIANLPATHVLGEFVCAHTIDGKKVYADTPIAVTENFLIGHTHHAFAVERSGKRIVNCGSIGQNRGRGDTLTYAVLDTDTSAVVLHAAPYPVGRFIRELVTRGYPQRCIDYYLDIQARGRAWGARTKTRNAGS